VNSRRSYLLADPVQGSKELFHNGVVPEQAQVDSGALFDLVGGDVRPGHLVQPAQEIQAHGFIIKRRLVIKFLFGKHSLPVPGVRGHW
jgi:hypothetical protein